MKDTDLIMKNETSRCQDVNLVVITVCLGLIVGCSSMLLGVLLDTVEHLFLGFVENNKMPVAVNALPSRRLVSLIIGGIISATIWYFLQRNWEPVGINDSIKGKRMPIFRTAIHVITQIFYVSTGGSIGRELAPRQAGAMIADNLSRFFNRHGWSIAPEDRRLLIAAAAGAGFAGVYISPITGTMFCLELLYKKINARSVAVSVTMSSIATMVGAITKGFVPYYLTGNRYYGLVVIPLAIFLGIVNGFLGTVFKRFIKLAGQYRAKRKAILWQFSLVGLLTGLVAMFFPAVCGNGRGLAQLAMNTTSSTDLNGALLWLVFGFFAKAIVTLLTIKGGGYGGTLTPSIAIGACTGVLLGVVYMTIVPGLTLAQCAVLGAVSLLAASQQAPLMALFMIFEVCHMQYSALLPLGLAVAVSIWVSKQMQK